MTANTHEPYTYEDELREDRQFGEAWDAIEDQDYIEADDDEEFTAEDLEWFEAIYKAQEIADRFYQEYCDHLYQDREQFYARIRQERNHDRLAQYIIGSMTEYFVDFDVPTWHIEGATICTDKSEAERIADELNFISASGWSVIDLDHPNDEGIAKAWK